MTQSADGFAIPNGSGATVRAAINADLQALASSNSGASAPPATFAGMLWLDTTNHVLKMRNEANSAWEVAGDSQATIASASTVNIGAASANYLNVTGTTTITAFDTIRAGTRRILEFAGALTLTHNATSLILPGGANITTAAGDVAVMVSEGSGNWRCVGYMRASVPPAVPFGHSFTSSQQTITAAGALTIAHGLPSKPTLLYAVLHCLTAEHGYSIGDEVAISVAPLVDTIPDMRGMGVVADATNLNIRFAQGNVGSVFLHQDKGTGVPVSLTNANWALIITAWSP